MLPKPLEEELGVHHLMVVVHLLLKVDLVMLHLMLEVLKVRLVQLLGVHRRVSADTDLDMEAEEGL